MTHVRWFRESRWVGISLACLMLVTMILGQGLAAGPVDGETRQETISVPLPESDVVIEQEADGSCRFSGEGIQYLGETGEPSIPCQSVTVLLPPDAQPASVRARVANTQSDLIPGQYDIRPVPTPVPEDGDGISAIPPAVPGLVDGRDVGVYGADALFPTGMVVKVDVQEIRQWKVAQIFYAPLAFNPVRKQLYRVSGDTIEVTFERSLFKVSFQGLKGTGSEAVQKTAVNFAQMAGAYGDMAASADAGGYVIITTRAIRSSSANLADFVASKENRGFTVQVITEETWGGGTGNAAAEHIRSWLKNNYLTMDIRYVLLIGNPGPSSGDVPMKMCYPQDYDPAYPECPTDFYYAELTSNWNSDGDGKYGEFDDDFRGNPPRAAEVAVGRIPYYGNMNDLDHILVKIMTYENARSGTVGWRKKALLPMEPSDQATTGYHLGEEIRKDVLIPEGWSYHRVYDSEYGLSPSPETVPCTADGVAQAWNGSEVGAIFWWTHGWAQGAADIMDLRHAATLDDEHPGFTFQCSCTNGKPEDGNNLGYSLLKNGCIATVSASRVSWYWIGQSSFAGTSSNSGMTFEYARRLIADEMYAGDALNDLRLDVVSDGGEFWMNYLDFNLYGCPAVGVGSSSADRQPPSVTTSLASDITRSTAVLNGTLVSKGTASRCQVFFEWGLTEAYDNTTLAQTMTSAGAFSCVISGLRPGTTYNFRARGTSDLGEAYGGNLVFTTGSEPPSVTTRAASAITVNTAILNGSLTSLGGASSAQVSFQWGNRTYGGGTTPAVAATGPFNAMLTGLKANTTYHFRAVAEGDVMVYGDDVAFTTLPIVPPKVVTETASDISAQSGRLNAELTSLGTADVVTVCFVWGVAPGGPYTNETEGYAMTRTGAFDFNLSGLIEGNTYYFKAKVVTNDGTVFGTTEKSFTTMAAPLVTTGYATNVSDTSATLNGSLNSLGTAGIVSVSFEWGASSDYGRETSPRPLSATVGFSADLTGLAIDTTYHFRAKVVGDSEAYGDDITFTTRPKSTPVAPVVKTREAEPVTKDSARLNGELTSLGTAGSVTVSFLWGTTRGGPYPNEVGKITLVDGGAFHFDLGGLASGTEFYYQAKTVGDGTSYGVEKRFTTSTSAPTSATTGAPVIKGLVADNGRAGDDLTVTISGSNLTGATVVAFGDGITVTEFRVVSDTEITAKIAIGSQAAAGERDVTLTTPQGRATSPSGFEVKEAGSRVHLWVYPMAAAGGVVVLGALVSLGVWLKRRLGK